MGKDSSSAVPRNDSETSHAIPIQLLNQIVSASDWTYHLKRTFLYTIQNRAECRTHDSGTLKLTVNEIHNILDAIELVLEEQGETESPYWLASQMIERKLWQASEHDVRAALEEDLKTTGEKSRFVKLANDEWALRSWNES